MLHVDRKSYGTAGTLLGDENRCGTGLAKDRRIQITDTSTVLSDNSCRYLKPGPGDCFKIHVCNWVEAV